MPAEPAGPAPAVVIDAHVHLLDVERLRYPWIEDHNPALTSLLHNYFDIAHDYDVADYRRDVTAPLEGSVACEFGAADGVAEATWVQGRAETAGAPDAFIAAVDLTSPSLAETLARYRDLPVVRAVRQPLYWAEERLRRLGARPDYLTDAAWWRGFERVAEAGLAWDLLVYAEQLADACPLIEAFPETPIVLEAAGWPLAQDGPGFSRWADQLRAVSQYPNVTLKLQGLALVFGTSLEVLRRWVGTALDIFGADRCMFATHFPVDRLLWSYDELVATLRTLLAEFDAGDQEAFYSGCARRVYGI